MQSPVQFEMEVVEVFRFSGERTVFVGPVSGADYIGRCDCELLFDGLARQQFEIQGEMIPDPRHEDGYRSISTTDEVDLDRSELTSHRCTIRSTMSP